MKFPMIIINKFCIGNIRGVIKKMSLVTNLNVLYIYQYFSDSSKIFYHTGKFCH